MFTSFPSLPLFLTTALKGFIILQHWSSICVSYGWGGPLLSRTHLSNYVYSLGVKQVRWMIDRPYKLAESSMSTQPMTPCMESFYVPSVGLAVLICHLSVTATYSSTSSSLQRNTAQNTILLQRRQRLFALNPLHYTIQATCLSNFLWKPENRIINDGIFGSV